MKHFVLSLLELDVLSKELSQNFTTDGVVILKGTLAAGKTTFVKNFVKYMGISDEVTSPTFSLQQVYAERIYHYDIYNKGLEHFLSLGLLEEFEKQGLHFVEWGDEKLEQLLKEVGFDFAVIEISKQTDDKREYKVRYET